MSDKNEAALTPPPAPPAPQTIAMVVPVPLYTQLVNLVTDKVTYRDAAPILQQLQALKPQEIRQG